MRKKKRPKTKKLKLWQASDVCAICNKKMKWKEANLDHKIPKSKGGTAHLWNLQLVHMKCNVKKADIYPYFLSAEDD